MALGLDVQPPPLWFLVFTKAGGEQSARLNLERQGYGVYYPRLRLDRLCRGRWIERIVGLFPRYLFVRVDPARQSLSPVRSTVGVSRIVTFGGEVAVVPEAIVDGLRQRADSQTGLHEIGSSRHFERGSLVRLIGGVFENLEGIFECEVGNDRSIVLLDLLGRSTSVQIPTRFVVPTGVFS